MAMDYLLIQATSVPCECVFSSAKEMDTAKRNWMNPTLMEALQLLKFSLKKEWLNFMDRWSTSEATLQVTSPPTHDLLGFLSAGDPNATMDDILNEFSTYDREC
jgi:hypothetical protein